MLLAPLQSRQRAQRRARDVRALGQDLQRGDQRVAPEQRVEAARVAAPRPAASRRTASPPRTSSSSSTSTLTDSARALPRPEPQRAVDAPRRRAPGRCRSAPCRPAATSTGAPDRLTATTVPRRRAATPTRRPAPAASRRRRRAGPRARAAARSGRARGAASSPGPSRWAATLHAAGRRRQPRRAPAVVKPRAAARRVHGIGVRQTSRFALRVALAVRHRVQRRAPGRAPRRSARSRRRSTGTASRAASSSTAAPRAPAPGRRSAQRVASRLASWLEPVHTGHDALGQHRLDALDDRRASAPRRGRQCTNRKLNARCSSSWPSP